MTDDGDGNGWREYQRLVLSDLRRLDGSVQKLGERIDNAVKHERNNRLMAEAALVADTQALAIEVHGLKIKAGIWGLAGGLIPVVVALVMKQL